MSASRPQEQQHMSSQLVSTGTGIVHTIDDINSAPESHVSTPAMYCADDIAASIVSEAERSAQAELRSTSEILKLAGCVIRRGSSAGALSPINTSWSPSNQAYVAKSCPGDRVGAGGSDNSAPSLSIKTSLSSSPLLSPPMSPTIDDSIHLPGKFGSLSSAEKMKLTSTPVKRTELLSKLDGLDRIVPSSSSIISNGSTDASDELANKVARSSSAVSAAMENAHAHANRIKKNNLSKKFHRPRGVSIGNSTCQLSSTPDSTLSLSRLAIDQSVHARSLRTPRSDTMPLWVQSKIAAEKDNTLSGKGSRASKYFGQYEIHSSETIITHEFKRGDWSWTSEWSPDGNFLALATENHSLAIIEVGDSAPTWKVVHDQRIGKVKNDTTHTIRSIAWGGSFIALGGTGDAVSIVEPCLSSSNGTQYSFDIVDVISETGFAGTLSWQNNNILAIGNREDQCLIADIRHGEDGTVTSNILHSIERSDWVTAVQFSHGGTKLAVGDRSGLLCIYLFVMIRPGEAPALSPIHDVSIGDSILDIQWSSDGKFLYTGGEDYSITILDTTKYYIQHKIGRDRWVTFLAPSRGGSYLAAGGVSSQVSLFDVTTKWKEVTSLPVEGGMPLSAKWHPRDEYLAICGQFNDLVVFESSCRRILKGKCLRSKSSILAVEFSPDGEIIAVGNDLGLVTFFDTLPNTFVTLYETVIGIGGSMSIKWSPNGKYTAIASGSTFVLLDTSYSGRPGTHPRSSARFSVRKVLQSGASFSSLSFSPNSKFLALSDDQTSMFDIENDCSCVRVLDQSNVIDGSNVVSSAWTDDGALFAMVGGWFNLSIYDVNSSYPGKWELLFSISFKATITSLSWGPSVKNGLQYLAFGGENETVAILEVRKHERNWETVLQIPSNSNINILRWNEKGMLCIGDDDGAVSIVDLSYLKSGKSVSEMNYNWQRQGIISTTKMTRNYGRNAITSLCWLPSNAKINKNILAIAGTDGIFELVDLSERSQLDKHSTNRKP
mmetsp:Transcript_17709/g.42666  ORF Transcript_17709/g.42666 Transcript_17709/m.42666 type:complete len:1002 (-) Transcript_17709:1100-4105(-)|eukprot:CAMPEP_0181092654 /NCGR_PEP_ID=MMETSP1071-20121207/9031_1 /TAXON_ID=35127 /ORGANISM="Thalassiosira sp., Strain NH16" /LENGTH=1001 /DNA_ID=CAMNT_0023174843 /DNA_START=194 /DNA_END=3199 /DNA_ORIENTATION=+